MYTYTYTPSGTQHTHRGGKLIYGDQVGYQDRELFRAFQDDTIVRLMSQTKPLVAAGVMMLIERGQLGLDDPLYKYHGGFRCVVWRFICLLS